MPHIQFAALLNFSHSTVYKYILACASPLPSKQRGKGEGLNDDWSLADKRKGFKGPGGSMLGWVQSYQVLGKRNVFPHLIELRPFFT